MEGTTSAADTSGTPDLAGLLNGAGATAAQGAIDQASLSGPAVAYSAGGAAVQGAIDALAPLAPYLVIGLALLIVLRR